jgi:hypothetical protein
VHHRSPIQAKKKAEIAGRENHFQSAERRRAAQGLLFGFLSGDRAICEPSGAARSAVAGTMRTAARMTGYEFKMFSFSRRAGVRARPCSLETHIDAVARFAIHTQYDGLLAAPAQAGGQKHIDLIHSRQFRRRARVCHGQLRLASLDRYVRQRAAMADARAEQNQIDLLGAVAQINRLQHEALRLSVVSRNGFIHLLAVGADAQRQG